MEFDNLPKPKGVSIFRTPVINKVPDDFPKNVSKEIATYICVQDIPEGAYALVTKGESMSPTLRDGDYIVFMPGETVNDGDVVVLLNEWGESILKRYRKREGDIYMVSDNPEYPMVKLHEKCRIVGKVILVMRKIAL